MCVGGGEHKSRHALPGGPYSMGVAGQLCAATGGGRAARPGPTPGRACGQPDPRRVPPRPDSQPARAAWPAATPIGQLTTPSVPPAAGPTHPRRPVAGPIRRLWPSSPPLRDTLPPAAGETTRHAVPPMQRGKTSVAMAYPQPSPSLPSSLHRESSTAIREPRAASQLAAPASLPCVAHVRAGAPGPPFQLEPRDTRKRCVRPAGGTGGASRLSGPLPPRPLAVQFGRSAVSNGRFGLPPSGGPPAATASLFALSAGGAGPTLSLTSADPAGPFGPPTWGGGPPGGRDRPPSIGVPETPEIREYAPTRANATRRRSCEVGIPSPGGAHPDRVVRLGSAAPRFG